MKKIEILGVSVDTITLADLLKEILYFIEHKKRKKIMYANIHVINSAFNDELLKRSLNRSDIVYCDGDGVRAGAYIIGAHIPERMTGADWIYDLCQIVTDRGYSIYLIGGREGIAERARDMLINKYPGLKIAGVHHGYFNISGDENRTVIENINSAAPDIVLVGFGTPLQEIWIDENRRYVNAPVLWAVGAVMDFVSNSMPRAPLLFRRYHMEWFYRLYMEPKRMWRRYIIGNVLFMMRAMILRIKKLMKG